MKVNVKTVMLMVALMCVFMWLFGNALSDQYFLTQWLEWMPTLFVFVLLAFISAALAWMRAWKHIMLPASLCIAVGLWYSMYENKLFVSCSESGALRIAAWTMSHPKDEFATESAEFIVNLNADITLLSHGWTVRGKPQITDWLGTNGKKLVRFPFTVLTKLPPIEIKPLIASNSIHIVSFTLDTTEKIGKPVVLWAVDFPSSFSRSRYDVALVSKRLLQEIEWNPPDIVAGDFNMTTDSAAVRYLFPQFRDASHLGGCGLMASYPRYFPIYLIDHFLVSDEIDVASYKLINPLSGRHRVQLMEIN